ncbi:MAG: uroporphyrinogen decarboxylase family protein [Acidobacteriota bacterium]|jgi:uroporphyrinogen-III decarboxylase|nr:uroporphyrinogen decarboxylase family protein [Acidobacteriota bacterium]
MVQTAQELFREREQRVLDAIALKKPDRVPVIPLFGAFASTYAGISRREELYDLKKSYAANLKVTLDLQPDMASAPLTFGPALESLDYRQLKWAGYGLPDHLGYQFVEGEYMKPEEYDAFLYDPSDFNVRVYWPRILGKAAAFQQMPPLRSMMSYFAGLSSGFMAFGSPDGAELLEAMRKAGEASLKMVAALQNYVQDLAAAGFPMFFAAGTEAPFDALGDFYRGTKGIVLDLYRRPEKVLAACEKMLPIMLESAIPAAKASGNPRVFIPLHKGSDNFMSLEQFKKFYWPTLKELLVGLVREGLTPVVLVEGQYTSRLETIRDVPEGKILYWFEHVDMAKAKTVVGQRACIMGDVPMSLLSTGTVDQVKEYCRTLLDTAGRDGGFILSSAANLDDAKPDNARALVDFAREHGFY